MAKRKQNGAEAYLEMIRLEEELMLLTAKNKYGKKRRYSDQQLKAMAKVFVTAETGTAAQQKMLRDFYLMNAPDLEAFLSIVRKAANVPSKDGFVPFSEELLKKLDQLTQSMNEWTMEKFGMTFVAAMLDPKAGARVLTALERMAGPVPTSAPKAGCAHRDARPLPIGWDAGGPSVISGMFTIVNWPTQHNCATRYVAVKPVEAYQPFLPAGWIYHWSVSIWPGVPGVGFRVLPGSDFGIYMRTWLWWMLGHPLFGIMLILA